MTIRPPTEHRWRSVVAVTGVVWTALMGCGGRSAEFRFRDSIDDPPLSGAAILREVGRVYCEANTFEAAGELRKRTSGSTEVIPIRWVFGPNGEYRFERDGAVLIFDGTYFGSMKDDETIVNVNMKAAEPESTEERQQAAGQMCRPDRAWGDMVMATGMMGDAMTFPEAAGRLIGSRWLRWGYQLEDSEFKRAGREVVNGVECEKVLSESGDCELTFWIDPAMSVLRKWAARSETVSVVATYSRLYVNGVLAENEFAITVDAIRRFEAEHN